MIQRWEFIKENKKVRKQELDKESDQEKKESFFFFFLGRFLGRVLIFLFSILFSYFLDRFLGRVLAFLISYLLL